MECIAFIVDPYYDVNIFENFLYHPFLMSLYFREHNSENNCWCKPDIREDGITLHKLELN